ncbi:MAG: RNA-dependent RNA polymerase [Hangzhou totivirus 12]|nr:MAG: RNA-dependent RNA polymerase [Hangzhou totivirus 12]
MRMKDNFSAQELQSIMAYVSISLDYAPILLFTCNSNPKNLHLYNGKPIQKSPNNEQPSTLLEATGLEERVLIYKILLTFYRYYSVLCVKNFLDEAVSFLFPEYVIKDTYSAMLEVKEILGNIQDKIASARFNLCSDRAIRYIYYCITGKVAATNKILSQPEYNKLAYLHQAEPCVLHHIFHSVISALWYASTEALPIIGNMWLKAVVDCIDDNNIGSALDITTNMRLSTNILSTFYCNLLPLHLLLPPAAVRVGDDVGYSVIKDIVCQEVADIWKLLHTNKKPAAYVTNNNFSALDTNGESVPNYIQAIFSFFQSHAATIYLFPYHYYAYIFKHLMFDSDGIYKPMLFKGNMRGGTCGLGLGDMHTKPGKDSKLVAPYFTNLSFSKAVRRKDIVWLDRFFPPASTTDAKHTVTRLSAIVSVIMNEKYLNHVAPKHLSVEQRTALYQKAKGEVIKLLRSMAIGTPMNVVLGMLILRLDREPELSTVLQSYEKSMLLSLPPKDMADVLKMLSGLYRRYGRNLFNQPISDNTVLKAAYQELLFGRSEFTSDIIQEIKNRCLRTKHLHSPKVIKKNSNCNQAEGFGIGWHKGQGFVDRCDTFYQQLRVELTDILSKLLPRRGVKMTYVDFLRHANNWLASGSAPGATVKLPNVEAPVGVGKRGWAEQLDVDALAREIWTSKAVEYAVASEKFENGKGRALYGVEQKHYMHSTYATKGLEERLHLIPGLEKGAGGTDALAFDWEKARLSGVVGVHCMMADYADFNIQHTPEAQALIYDILAEIGQRRGACADWVQANKYVARAKYNMQCKFPRDITDKKRPVVYSVVQGMFSGTRSTDLINTLLNLAYYRIAAKAADRLYGQEVSKSVHHVHQGDDVWISCNDQGWCAILYYMLNSMGLETQSVKQMFGPNRGEFLRVFYSKGEAKGYLMRCIANMLLKEIQRPLVQDVGAMLTSISVSLNTAVRRQLSPLAHCILEYDLIGHYRKVSEFYGDPAPVTVPYTLVYASPAVGGLGLNRPQYACSELAGSDNTTKHAKPFPHLQPKVSIDLTSVPTKCTDNWITTIYKYLSQFGDGVNIQALRNSSVATNYADAFMVAYRRSIYRQYKKEVRQHVATSSEYLLSQCRNSKTEQTLPSICTHVPIPAKGTHFRDYSDDYLNSMLGPLVQKAGYGIPLLVQPSRQLHTLRGFTQGGDIERTTAFEDSICIPRKVINLLKGQMIEYDPKKALSTPMLSTLCQATVRSELKSLPKLKTAAGITNEQALTAILVAAVDFESRGNESANILSNLLAKVQQKGVGCFKLALDAGINELGILERMFQPNLLQLLRRLAIDNLINTSLGSKTDFSDISKLNTHVNTRVYTITQGLMSQPEWFLARAVAY